MKHKTFLHRFQYDRSRFKFIEKISFRFLVFWDRKIHRYAIYKTIPIEAQAALAKLYKIEENISQWLVFEEAYYSYGKWCQSVLLKNDMSRGGTIGTDRILRQVLDEIDEDKPQKDRTEFLRDLQYEMNMEYYKYVTRGRTSLDLGSRTTKLHKNLKKMPKKIFFKSKQTGKIIGEMDVHTRKIKKYAKIS